MAFPDPSWHPPWRGGSLRLIPHQFNSSDLQSKAAENPPATLGKWGSKRLDSELLA